LSSFDPPRWVNEDHIKVTNFITKKLPIEVLHIAINKGVIGCLFEGLSTLVKYFDSPEIFETVVFEVMVHVRKFEGHNLLRIVVLVVTVRFGCFSFFGRSYSLFLLWYTYKLNRSIWVILPTGRKGDWRWCGLVNIMG